MSGTGRPLYREFIKGIWQENPVLVLVLGTCPTLAVTTSVLSGFSMGMAATFVLVCSGVALSPIRKLIPDEVRIATYTAIIALFVTVAKMVLDARFPEISAKLGPYIPLIVVNCIILGRMEAFCNKNNMIRSFLDTLGMGVGFTLTLLVLGAVRELLGSGTVLGGTPWETKIYGETIKPMVVMLLPAGAFIMFGLLVGAYRALNPAKR